jgi:hypothetical protein
MMNTIPNIMDATMIEGAFQWRRVCGVGFVFPFWIAGLGICSYIVKAEFKATENEGKQEKGVIKETKENFYDMRSSDTSEDAAQTLRNSMIRPNC